MIGCGAGCARGEAQEARHAVLLGRLERGLHHVVRLLAVGGLEHGRARELRNVAVVLLVLRGVHARVVRRDHHHAARGAHVRERHERVHRHVEAHVLHGRERPGAGHRRADRGLHGDLLVHGPLALDGVLELGDVLEDFRGGRAGVGAGHDAAGLRGAARHGLVSGQQDFLRAHLRAFSTSLGTTSATCRVWRSAPPSSRAGCPDGTRPRRRSPRGTARPPS